jgi:hypothetical protein
MPGDMPQDQAQAPQPQGGVKELVSNVHDQMVQLLDVLDQSQVASPEDKQVLANILQQYRSFVGQSLGAGPKEEGQKAGGGGNTPMEFVDQGSVLPA